MTFTSFLPGAGTRTGPGPADVHPRIREARSRPAVGHLDPQSVARMDELKGLLRYPFRTRSRLTMPVSAPGSAGMETCFVNLVEPGDKVLVCVNGVFGGRMKANLERAAGAAVAVEDPWGRAVDPDKLRAALKTHGDAKVGAFVHASLGDA